MPSYSSSSERRRAQHPALSLAAEAQRLIDLLRIEINSRSGGFAVRRESLLRAVTPFSNFYAALKKSGPGPYSIEVHEWSKILSDVQQVVETVKMASQFSVEESFLSRLPLIDRALRTLEATMSALVAYRR
ncbi:hypothetical protein EIP91_005151 [Steccherinum ochraceum]|uniref:Uncharacterized protein n=1 Tax=Steccherinum ochraceum TaxID=92696 RepID=A0A4R0RMT5_9APHY|nr:hypothetical protein EIP91_005151 [Steccherinum ochraceum]